MRYAILFGLASWLGLLWVSLAWADENSSSEQSARFEAAFAVPKVLGASSTGVKQQYTTGVIRNVSIARVGADGKIETLCTSDVKTAKAWLADAPHSAVGDPK